jgi:hypothetical protein
VLKRFVVLAIVAAFFVAPPAIAKSSSTVVKQAPAAKAKLLGGHGDGQCPGDRAAALLSL